MEPLKVIRRPEQLLPEDNRVIARYFDFPSRRHVKAILGRIMRLSDRHVSQLLEQTRANFAMRHRDMEAIFRDNFHEVQKSSRLPPEISEERKLLIGAYFTMEYSIESAALFNPSIVAHPDQSNLPEGALRFLMSMRATGEGHVSSIVFRRGIMDASGEISFDPPPQFAYCAKPTPDQPFEKAWFFRKLIEMGTYEPPMKDILDELPDHFNLDQLQQVIHSFSQKMEKSRTFQNAVADMIWVASANYELCFPPDCMPAEIVVFPATENECHGMEDLRLVYFVDDNRETFYAGTYTAFDGQRIRPMMIQTCDFTTFKITTLGGKYAKNKGMALFPRRIGGCYMMISRHDAESLYLLTSYELHFWNEAKKLQKPNEPWELMKIGNCGSPLETEAGWILLTHGVGPIRQYCIGASLLDRDDPSCLLGRLKEPLLIPAENEREGYVPNVVYSCGSIIHNDQLIVPYAMSDSRTSFATVSVSELLDRLLASGP